jgi:hypothetical protein
VRSAPLRHADRGSDFVRPQETLLPRGRYNCLNRLNSPLRKEDKPELGPMWYISHQPTSGQSKAIPTCTFLHEDEGTAVNIMLGGGGTATWTMVHGEHRQLVVDSMRKELKMPDDDHSDPVLDQNGWLTDTTLEHLRSAGRVPCPRPCPAAPWVARACAPAAYAFSSPPTYTHTRMCRCAADVARVADRR